MTRLTEPEISTSRAQRTGLPGLEVIQPPSPTRPRPKQAQPAKRLSKLWLGLPLAIILAVVGVWSVVQRARAGAAMPDITVFEVRPMSFPVILTAKGEVKAKKNTEIRCEVEGRSTIVWLIEEGEQVEEGDLLVELANDGGGGGLSIEDRIKQAEISVANAKAAFENAQKNYEIQLDLNKSNIRKGKLAVELADGRFEKYLNGDSVQDLRTLEIQLREAQAVLRRRKADFETSKQLFERGYITKTEHETDHFNVFKAELNVEKAELAVKIHKEYAEELERRQLESAVEDAKRDLERTIKSAEAQAAQSKAQLEAKKAQYDIEAQKLAKLKKQREHLEIYAPGPGMVVYHRSGRYWDPQRIEVGATVHERQVLIDLPDPSIMQVAVKINESQMDKIELDLPATVEIEGVTGERFTGRVTKIGVLADAQHRWLNPNLKEYTNEITLDQSHASLKPGMSATAEILVTKLDDVLAIPVQCVFSKAGRSYAFVREDDGTISYRDIELGLASTEYVRVLKGLEAGDQVCLAIDDEMKRKLPTDVGPVQHEDDTAGPAMDKDKAAAAKHVKSKPADKRAKPDAPAKSKPKDDERASSRPSS